MSLQWLYKLMFPLLYLKLGPKATNNPWKAEQGGVKGQTTKCKNYAKNVDYKAHLS